MSRTAVQSASILVVIFALSLLRETRCVPILWDDIVMDMGIPEIAVIARPTEQSLESRSLQLQALNDLIRRVVGSQNVRALRPSEPFSNNDATSWERLGWGWGKRR